jgi:peptidyl-prolyl cis-trans isomerase SurA
VRTIVATLLCASFALSARADVIERVVAVVDERAILLSELRRRAAPFLAQAHAGASSELDRRMRTKELYAQLLQQLIDEQLVEDAARTSQLTVTSVEVDQAIENVRTQNRLEPDQFWEAVRNQGFTEKQYRQDVRKQLLRLKVINQKVRSRISITEDNVREEYDARVREARRTQRFRAAHVFRPLEPDASATDVARVVREMQAVKSELTADGFDAAMEQQGGGDLGWLDQGDLPGELEEALLDLGVGEISEPVRGPSGVHVFLLRERQRGEQALPPFEEASAAIQRELVDRALARQEKMFLAGLRRDAVIQERQ